MLFICLVRCSLNKSGSGPAAPKMILEQTQCNCWSHSLPYSLRTQNESTTRYEQILGRLFLEYISTISRVHLIHYYLNIHRSQPWKEYEDLCWVFRFLITDLLKNCWNTPANLRKICKYIVHYITSMNNIFSKPKDMNQREGIWRYALSTSPTNRVSKSLGIYHQI